MFIIRKKAEYEQFTCRIEEDLLEQLRQIKRKNNLFSVNFLINECIRYALKNIEIK